MQFFFLFIRVFFYSFLCRRSLDLEKKVRQNQVKKCYTNVKPGRNPVRLSFYEKYVVHINEIGTGYIVILNCAGFFNVKVLTE